MNFIHMGFAFQSLGAHDWNECSVLIVCISPYKVALSTLSVCAHSFSIEYMYAIVEAKKNTQFFFVYSSFYDNTMTSHAKKKNTMQSETLLLVPPLFVWHDFEFCCIFFVFVSVF